MADTNRWICSYPWVHLRRRVSGAYVPCCNFKGEVVSDLKSTFNEVFHGPELNEIRQKMLVGETVAGCSNCANREAAHSWSMRQEANRDFPMAWNSPPVLKYVEFNLGNLCNLKCRGCDSTHSSKWILDERRLGRVSSDGEIKPALMSLMQGSWENLTQVKLIGGEPLLNPKNEEFLSHLDRLGRLPEVKLQYVTNGTIRISSDVLQMWRRVKHLHLIFSVDGLGPSNDFFREGSVWPEVHSNIQWYTENLRDTDVSWGFHNVVSIYNIFELDELDKRLQKDFPAFGISREILVNPSWLDIRILPKNERKRLASHYFSLASQPQVPPSLRESYFYVAQHLEKPAADQFSKFLAEETKLNELWGRDFSNLDPQLLRIIHSEEDRSAQ